MVALGVKHASNSIPNVFECISFWYSETLVLTLLGKIIRHGNSALFFSNALIVRMLAGRLTHLLEARAEERRVAALARDRDVLLAHTLYAASAPRAGIPTRGPLLWIGGRAAQAAIASPAAHACWGQP